MTTPTLLPLSRLILFSPVAKNLLRPATSSFQQSSDDNTDRPLILDERIVPFYSEGLLLPLYRRSDSWAEFRYNEASMAIIVKAVDFENYGENTNNNYNDNNDITNYEKDFEPYSNQQPNLPHSPILDFICPPSNNDTSLMAVLSRCLTHGGNLQGQVKHNAFGSVCCVTDPTGLNRIGLFEPNE